MELKYGFISADDHVYEHPDVWTSRMSRQKWGDRIPHVERQADGSDCWIIGGLRFALPEVDVSQNGSAGTARCKRWDEIPRQMYSASERLAAMDRDGVDYSVFYPTVAGLSGQVFGRLDDPELEIACVRAYNDSLIDEWSRVSSRFIPQCIVPIWPIDHAVTEVQRAVAKGHKGVVFPASPMQLRDVPHINEPAYDPLWGICEDLGVPLCFHAGAAAKIQLSPGEGFTPHVAAAFSDVVRSVSSIAVLANFLVSRILHRFPKLKVVFAESSLGWGAYEIEYADYQSAADGLPSEGYPLKPSELFRRQCYFTCWYDQASLKVRRYLGAANILWSTNFPLANSTWPHMRQRIEAGFADVPDEEKQQMLWQNAAKLYSL